MVEPVIILQLDNQMLWNEGFEGTRAAFKPPVLHIQAERWLRDKTVGLLLKAGTGDWFFDQMYSEPKPLSLHKVVFWFLLNEGSLPCGLKQ